MKRTAGLDFESADAPVADVEAQFVGSLEARKRSADRDSVYHCFPCCVGADLCRLCFGARIAEWGYSFGRPRAAAPGLGSILREDLVHCKDRPSRNGN